MRSFFLFLLIVACALAAPAPTKAPVSRPPSRQPTPRPTRLPTGRPTSRPTSRPSARPTSRPTRRPSKKPVLSSAGPEHKPSTALVAGVVIGVVAGVGIGVGAYMNSKKRAAERLSASGGTHILLGAEGDIETLNPILEIDAHSAGHVKNAIVEQHGQHGELQSIELTEDRSPASVHVDTASTTHSTHEHTIIEESKPWGEPVETPDLSPIKTPRPDADGFDDWDSDAVIL